MTYRDFFRELTGHVPAPYQERVAELILAGRSIILRVPTGAGKTWAVTAPFLYSLWREDRFADRLLYALPLRSLAASLHTTVYHEMKKQFGDVMSSGKDRDYTSSKRYCSVQMGGQKDDPFFESDIVFTTIDQLLSGYLMMPVSLPNRLANINAGALLGSYVVFDELHLLEASVALGTAVEMLHRLMRLSQFCLMTATMSTGALEWLANELDAEVACVPDKEIRLLPSQRTKRRYWRWVGRPIQSDAVTTEHQGGRSIALVNSVRRAQELFLEIERHYREEPDAPELILLHARFFPEDRRAIEARLDAYFGPKATRSNVILVTTQVVEAGMDLSAEILHTEMAPMNTLIQRAGRTARYAKRNNGAVFVYESSGRGPYSEEQELLAVTQEVLARMPVEGRLVDFVDERAFIEEVHGRAELAALEVFSIPDRRNKVHEAMDLGERGRLNNLVRNVDSTAVLISDCPEEVRFERGVWPRLLSVPGASLMRLGQAMRDSGPGQWVAKGASESEEEQRGVALKWRVLSPADLRSQWLIAVHPDFAAYNDRLGLRLEVKTPPPPIHYNEPPSVPRYRYEFEPWVDHARRVVEQGRALARHYLLGLSALSRLYGVPVEHLMEIVDICCAQHDAGKLSAEWQAQAWKWQRDKDGRSRAQGLDIPERIKVPIAHTSYDPETDNQLQRRSEYRLPPHAVQGAFAIATSLLELCKSRYGASFGETATLAACSAIARHHAPRAFECTRFTLDAGAEAASLDGLPWRPGGWKPSACLSPLDAKHFGLSLLRLGEAGMELLWPLYVFLARWLRLADQSACRTDHKTIKG